MSLQNLRDYVRLMIDVDTTDIPDSLMDVFLREGVTKIAYSSNHWNFYEAEASFSTIAAQRAYSYATAFGSTIFQTINSVETPHWRLDALPHAQAQQQFVSVSGSGTQEPRFFSSYANSLYLWPLPDAAYACIAQGYRTPLDFTTQGSGASPDLPAAFHELVGKWAISLAYAQQDDTQNASYFAIDFANTLKTIRGPYENMEPQGIMALGSNGRRVTGQLAGENGRGRFPWE